MRNNLIVVGGIALCVLLFAVTVLTSRSQQCEGVSNFSIAAALKLGGCEAVAERRKRQGLPPSRLASDPPDNYSVK